MTAAAGSAAGIPADTLEHLLLQMCPSGARYAGVPAIDFGFFGTVAIPQSRT